MTDETPDILPVRIPKLSGLSPSLIGTYVKLHGWITSSRTQGAGTLQFLDLSDGSTVTPTRCMAEKAAEAPAEPQTHAYSSTNLLQSNACNGDEACYSRIADFESLTQTAVVSNGCSVMLFGYVAAPPENATQNIEVKILELYTIGPVADATKYPITKSILQKPLALRALPHARFRAPLLQQLLKIRSEALFAIHEFFHDSNVPLLDPNILTASDCEGAGEVFKVAPQMFTPAPVVEEESKKKKKKKNKKKNKEGDGEDDNAAAAEEEQAKAAAAEEEEKAKEAAANALPPPEVGLTVSSQLPLEAIAMGTGAVYTCQKSFRAEKSDTNKHLAEFLHVEYEEYFITLDDLVAQAESYVKHVCKKVLERCTEQYDYLDNGRLAPPEFRGHRAYLLELLEKPFKRITHAEAIDGMLQDVRDKVQHVNAQGKTVRLKFKEMPQHGEDLGSEHEKYLVQKYGTFVFVTHWPSAIKSFYMKQVGDGTCEAFDLLAPIVGELFGGSMREWRLEELQKVMASKKMTDVASLEWFVDLRKDGTAPHGGWGMGFDRLVMFLTNAASVRDVVPYPVYYGHCPY